MTQPLWIRLLKYIIVNLQLSVICLMICDEHHSSSSLKLITVQLQSVKFFHRNDRLTTFYIQILPYSKGQIIAMDSCSYNWSTKVFTIIVMEHAYVLSLHSCSLAVNLISLKVSGVLFKQRFTIFSHKNNDKKPQATHKNKKGFQYSGIAISLLKVIFKNGLYFGTKSIIFSNS